MDWGAIIWFVIWAVVIFAAIALAVWITMAVFAARTVRKVSSDFDKGFDSEFFKRHR